MSENVKNLMETSGDDKSLGNIAVDENVLANASTADSTIPNDSQSFTLADFDSSLQEIDGKKVKIMRLCAELLAKAREHDAVQDGGAVEDSSLQRNINDDDKDNKNKDELTERMEEDEIIEGTPPDERVSPLKRPMAKRNGSEEPASKIQRIDTDVIEPVKSSTGSEANSTEHSQDDKSKDKVADANENTVKAIDGVKDTLANDKVEGESLSELTQALENVLEDKAEKDEAQDTVPDELVVKSSITGDASKKSRQSIEVIFDKALAPPPKPKEVVELDEDGEKIVLDSSQEDEDSQASDSNTIVNSTGNKNKITNGNNSSKSSESDRTASMQSDLSDESGKINIVVKDNSAPLVVTLPSDNEADSSIDDNKSKIKTVPVEREFTIVMKVKCLLHVDSQNSKECVGKEVMAVYCENYPDLHSPSSRMNSDASILADVSASDNKEISSPSSVSSNPHPLPYSLPPSRHSIVSTVSTSSSSSCASSVKSSSGSSTKSSTKDNPFSLPRGFAKHAKKPHDMNAIDESPEYIKHGWRNVNLITTNIIDHLNNEIATADLSAHNGSTNEHIDGPLTRMASSTPESKAIPSTPKTSKKGKVTKRTKTRSTRSRTNGATKASAEAAISLQEEFKSMKEKEKEKDKAQPAVSTPSRASSRAASTLRNQTPVVDESADSRVGKLCFAKWSDGTYYPAVVVSKNKTKFKVNFFDDKSKLVSEAFVYVINDTLSPNDIVCVEINEKDSYESSAVVNEVEKDGDEVWYHLETEEKKNLRLTIKDIFLTPDHFKKFKESEIASAEVPSTPHFEKITLDNVIEGSRRHKSTTSPSASRASQAQSQGTSGSGKSAASNQSNAKKNYDTSDSDTKPEVVTELGDVNPEIAGISSASTSKGPSSRIKGKGKSKKKADDEETIKKFGPIPEPGSTLFKRFNFILTCAPLECLDAIKQAKPVPSDCSEEGTDYEVEWSSIPFLRERLVEQITAGGGRVYNTFDEIPPAEYSKTKLITNVPNITATSLLCLSVGILPYNHQWIITSCINNKLGSPEGSELPAGYSLRLENYVKNHERPGNKPFEHLKVVIPKISVAESSVNLWKRVIENAGGVVAFIDSPEDEFFDATVVVTNQNCPAWVEKKALSYEIPLVTTTWVVQCIVEGATVPGIEERCKHKKTSEPS